jgi:hypothetical protein
VSAYGPRSHSTHSISSNTTLVTELQEDIEHD